MPEPDTFTVRGAVWEFLPDSTLDDPYLGVLSAVTGRFVANVTPPTALPVRDGAGIMYLATPVEFTVLPDGQISADGENPGVPLTADDESYGLGRPLRWSLVVDAFELDSVVIEPPVVWVDAAQFEADQEVPFSHWAADPEVWPIAVARGPRGLRGYTGASGAPGASGASGAGLIVGTGDPEGTVTAAVGTVFSRTDGGAGTALYVKEAGTGNTGWAALLTAEGS